MLSDPSPWILRFADLVSGPVLDLACGSGRHTVFFAERGHGVTAVDRDISRLGALTDHPNVSAIAADLEAAENAWRPPPDSFGAVVVTNYLWHPLLPALIDALQPGGVLLYETFAAGNEAFGKPSNPDFLLRPGDLLDAVRPALSVIAYENGEIASPRPAVVQRICAVRDGAVQRL